MSELLSRINPEVKATEEALRFADETLVRIKTALDEDLPLTGLDANDRTNASLRNYDREIQAEIEGTGFIYFGHTRRLENYLYDALIAGYKPSPAQMENYEGHDFMWDEVSDLHEEHWEIYEITNKYGYNSKLTPTSVGFCGALMLPEDIVKDILVIMHENGRSYREMGWGFPWISDEIPQEEANS